MRSYGTKFTGIFRLAVVAFAVLIQLSLLALLVVNIRQYAVYVYFVLEAVAFAVVFILVDNNSNSSYTLTWIIIILLTPVFGLMLFAMWGRTGTNLRKSKKTRSILSSNDLWLKKNPQVMAQLALKHPSRKRIAEYLENESFPIYENTRSSYFQLGELQLEAMIQDMEKAEHFIFLEYFILAEGKVWDRIHQIIKNKAAQGVEIRLLYDDFGSIVKAPEKLMETLKSEKIKVLAFNPVHRYISRFYINYRNHQKITVIDGNIGYTGGTNLADEYANVYPKLGHWKDTAIKLEGDAVWSLTVAFLQMWETESGTKEDYNRYKPMREVTGDGFYQPFVDGPVNNPHNPAETMYRKLISNARDYVYITTPYLVINDFMLDELCIAAKSGVDVRIVTPKIWDRWYVHMVTRSNYGKLMESGVRIFEYSPGYIHAKTIISDDDHAIIGSINMDYRSFNLHFENGVWICGSQVLQNVKKDILDTITICEEIQLEQWKKRKWHIKLIQGILRLFAPLL